MKKFLLLTLIFGALTSTNLLAQAGDGQTKSMLELMKERHKAPMVAKTGLTEAQVDGVLEINAEIKQASMLLNNLPEAERPGKFAALKEVKDKMYREIPLTAEQVKSVYAYFEEIGKNMQKKGN